MRRFSAPLAVVAVVLLTLTTLGGLGTAAQEATPSAMAAHPVVGAWRTTVSVGEAMTFRTVAMFHADGT